MEGNARLSPRTRGVADIGHSIRRREAHEAWHQPRKLDFAAIVGAEMWQRDRANWHSVLDLLKKSQELAEEMRLQRPGLTARPPGIKAFVTSALYRHAPAFRVSTTSTRRRRAPSRDARSPAPFRQATPSWQPSV